MADQLTCSVAHLPSPMQNKTSTSMKGLCHVDISDSNPQQRLGKEPTHLSRQQDEGGIEEHEVEVDHGLQVSL